MSLTVSRLMELPSLRRAKVLGGRGGLDRIVSSISVLEYSSTTYTQKKLFESIEFQGSEIVITAFSNVADDVEAQCANIRSMSEVGEVGMILYYVGIIMPSVDQRLVKLADELDFVLICMPENEPDTPEAISWMTWGCAYSATIPARNAAEKRVSRAGTFFTIRNPVNTGTRSSHGEMLKVPVSTSENVSTCDISGEWCMRLATRKTITATVMDGTVVRSI